MLEKMDAFFEARLDGYDAHMLQNIAGAMEFYPFTAENLPTHADAAILDLGCGTGLELEYYFACNPTARVTGIDLSQKMLDRLRQKFPSNELTLLQGSYFDIPMGEEIFNAAVSVESLHHFTQAQKIPLYTRLRRALKPGGWFILTDYFAENDQEEMYFFHQLQQMKEREGIKDHAFYHFDMPLTVAHETEALLLAGFQNVRILKNWGETYTLKAIK